MNGARPADKRQLTAAGRRRRVPSPAAALRPAALTRVAVGHQLRKVLEREVDHLQRKGSWDTRWLLRGGQRSALVDVSASRRGVDERPPGGATAALGPAHTHRGRPGPHQLQRHGPPRPRRGRSAPSKARLGGVQRLRRPQLAGAASIASRRVLPEGLGANRGAGQAAGGPSTRLRPRDDRRRAGGGCTAGVHGDCSVRLRCVDEIRRLAGERLKSGERTPRCERCARPSPSSPLNCCFCLLCVSVELLLTGGWRHGARKEWWW